MRLMNMIETRMIALLKTWAEMSVVLIRIVTESSKPYSAVHKLASLGED